MKYFLTYCAWLGLDYLIFGADGHPATMSVLVFTATAQTLVVVWMDVADMRKRLKALEKDNRCSFCNLNVNRD